MLCHPPPPTTTTTHTHTTTTTLADEDFMGLFTAAGVLAALEAQRDALARRVEGLVRCAQEFKELARVL